MGPHSQLCGLLLGELNRLRGQAATDDGALTVLANWMEEQVGRGGSTCVTALACIHACMQGLDA